MNIQDINARIKDLPIFEMREMEEDYLELVFQNEDLEKWNFVFTDILGAPIKPAGAKVTQEHSSLTQKYGGIATNQTLFAKDFDSHIIITMFWPWSNGQQVTLKVIKP